MVMALDKVPEELGMNLKRETLSNDATNRQML